jgi:hypothetical protein
LYITTKAIRFCLASKIILLCFLLYTIYLLQLLDIGIFAALATAYKAGIQEQSKYIVSYNIDKLDFLEIISIAREKAIILINIQKV